MERSLDMSKEITNWADTFMYHENLVDAAQSISAWYTQLCIHNRTHTDQEKWGELAVKWERYRRNEIPNLILPTEADAQREVDNLNQEYYKAEKMWKALQANPLLSSDELSRL